MKNNNNIENPQFREMRGPGRGGGEHWNEPRGRGERRGGNDYRQDSRPRDPIDQAPYGHGRDEHYMRGGNDQHSRGGRNDFIRRDDPYGRDRRSEEPHPQRGTYNQDRSSHPHLPDRRDDRYAPERGGNHPSMDIRGDPYARDRREDPYSGDTHTRDKRPDPYNRDPYPRDVRDDPYGRDRTEDPYARDTRDPFGRGGRDDRYPDRREEQDRFRGRPDERFQGGPSSQPSQDKPMGGLLQKLAGCSIQDEDDLKLATSVISSLVKSLKDYNTISGQPNIASLMSEVELNIHKVKAMRVAMRVLGSGPQMGQSTTK